jgi:hypothetical protein
MNISLSSRTTAALLASVIALTAITPAQATTPGDWVASSEKNFCSLGTKQKDGGMFIMMTTSSGASGIMIKPADQSLITSGTDYPIKVSINNSSDHDVTANAGDFGGVKVLHIKLNAAAIAAGEADGFAFRVSLGGTVVFDKDLHGAHDEFAAFVACSKQFTGK